MDQLVTLLKKFICLEMRTNSQQKLQTNKWLSVSILLVLMCSERPVGGNEAGIGTGFLTSAVCDSRVALCYGDDEKAITIVVYQRDDEIFRREMRVSRLGRMRFSEDGAQLLVSDMGAVHLIDLKENSCNRLVCKDKKRVVRSGIIPENGGVFAFQRDDGLQDCIFCFWDKNDAHVKSIELTGEFFDGFAFGDGLLLTVSDEIFRSDFSGEKKTFKLMLKSSIFRMTLNLKVAMTISIGVEADDLKRGFVNSDIHFVNTSMGNEIGKLKVKKSLNLRLDEFFFNNGKKVFIPEFGNVIGVADLEMRSIKKYSIPAVEKAVAAHIHDDLLRLFFFNERRFSVKKLKLADFDFKEFPF